MFSFNFSSFNILPFWFILIGIRSQSKPLDIMYEVFRAMKALDFVSTQINC